MAYYNTKNYTVERSVGFLLNALATHVNDELDTLLKANLGVNLGQWKVLTTLEFNQVTTAAALCQELNYDSGAMTRMLDKLESLELVARKDEESDRRAYKLKITKRGRVVALKGFEMARENLNRLLASMTNDESDQLISLLQKLKATI